MDCASNTNGDTPLLFDQYCNNSNYDCDRLCDSARLTFNFTLNETSDLSVSYVFASEEYNEYVGYKRTELFGMVQYSQFSDVFAFFLDGENLALASDGSFVSLQTVNRGNPCTFERDDQNNYTKPFNARNEDQFVDNDIWFNRTNYQFPCPDECGCPAVESTTRGAPGSYVV